MSQRARRVSILAALVLALTSTLLATRIVRHYQRGGAGRLELGPTRLVHIEPGTLEALERVEGKVHATYFVSAAHELPSPMGRIEEQVTSFLEALADAAPDRFAYRVVHPGSDPDLERLAARRNVSPYRVRTVTRDAYEETTVWSTLLLEAGSRRRSHVPSIDARLLPRLQSLVRVQLEELVAPGQAVFALAASERFDRLGEILARSGKVLRVDLDRGEPIPAEAQLLFWMNPRHVTSARIEELERYLHAGGSAVVAGGLLAADGRGFAGEGEELTFQPAASRFAGEPLLRHFGLEPQDGLFCDRFCEPLVIDGEERAAPFVLRCIAPNQDFASFSGSQPNGTLFFAAPAPLLPVGTSALDRGWRSNTLATSSDEAFVLRPADFPGGRIPFADMQPGAGQRVPKQPLLVAVEHTDPWVGSLVFSSATTPFENGLIDRPGTAHLSLLEVLLGELGSPARRAFQRAAPPPATPLPELSSTDRMLWRFAAVFLVPLAALLVSAGRGLEAVRRLRPRWRFALGASALLPLAWILTILPGAQDLTADRRHTLSAAGARLARTAAPIEAHLTFSDEARLPATLARVPERLMAWLREFERAGLELRTTRTRPEELDPEERSRLTAGGIRPRRLVSREGEVQRVREVFASLTLSVENQPPQQLDFTDSRDLEDLQFRLAFALARLSGRPAPHVGFASDLPRLSAAEAHENFQTRGLFAPQGKDVYAEARARLERLGYRVTHVNPRAPDLPPDLDLLVWMQPRRSIEPMLESTVRYLHGGGRVLLAAQHFQLQSRQYKGDDFDVVHWPQPQSPDVEHLYFPELSIELVREVLFDDRSFARAMDSQVAGRTDYREFERQEASLPCFVRTSSANYADHKITAFLGDQAFANPNALRWDPERLEELGLRATVLITTSARTWSLDWSGGWLPPEVLVAPEDGDFDGKRPLAVLFEGRFPKPKEPLRLRPDEEGEVPADAAPWPPSAEGQLLFLGCSSVFQSDRILDPTYRGSELLENAVASLTLDGELADLATRRTTARGFDFVAPSARLNWRAWMVSSGPLALVLGGSIVALRRRRPSPLPRAR